MTRSKTNRLICKPRFRVLVGDLIALGPGKIDLLEAVDRTGSISQAAREIHLSYRRAWDMIDTMNQSFKNPLVTPTIGGKGGGGACLTPLGKKIASVYRTMETKAKNATEAEWKIIRRSLKRKDLPV